MIHGDLTPSNVIVNQSGRLTITDFGFSQSQRSQPVSDTDDAPEPLPLPLGGTIGFAAPEQISPAFGHISHKTDIYAVGGLAYWYLTGRPPHHADSFEQSVAETISPADVETAFIPAASPVIQQVALDALRKSPAARPNRIKEIAGLLAAAGR